MRHPAAFLFLLASLLLPALPGRCASVTTDDGLALEFRNADAAITAVRAGGRPLKLNGSPGGFSVADMIHDQLLGKMDHRSAAFPGTRIPTTARSSPTGVVLQGQANDLWVRARIDRRGNTLAATGDLVNLRPEEERAVILYFRLPVDAAGARWGRNLGVEEPVQPGQRYLNATHFHQAYRPAMSRLPIAALSGDGWGLSMAQPMDASRFFRLAYQAPYGLQIEYEFGLSPITWKFRNRAPFQFFLYRHDPAWGLRSAFERYYRFFPELFRKVVRDGMWIDDWEGKRTQLGDPADYGIVFNETGHWADEEQRAHDVLSMMYIEPWCDHIEATPDQIPAIAEDTPANHKESRRDHMPYVDFPLTFDHKTGQVTITHGFSAIEFLRWCTTQARSDSRPTMGNASPGYFLPFVAPYLDMGGAGENYEYEPDFAGLKEVRALMYQKPLSYLNNAELADPAKAEAVMDRLLLYACYPGAASTTQMKAQRALYRAYIPLYNALGAAGWEPVPYARMSPPDAWCERFGRPGRGYFFTIRNPGNPRTLTLTLDPKSLGIPEPSFVAVTGCRIQRSDPTHVRLTMPARWTALLAVNRAGAPALAAAHRRELAIVRASAHDRFSASGTFPATR